MVPELSEPKILDFFMTYVFLPVVQSGAKFEGVV